MLLAFAFKNMITYFLPGRIRISDDLFIFLDQKLCCSKHQAFQSSLLITCVSVQLKPAFQVSLQHINLTYFLPLISLFGLAPLKLQYTASKSEYLKYF